MRTALLALACWLSASRSFADVGFTEGDQTVEISAGDKPFTIYRYGAGVTKPFFWPILGPRGGAVTRGYPNVPDVPGEPHDHPWHRGLSFTHGEVDVEGGKSVDF